MKIIIGGAGAVGTHLAKLLSKEKQDIVLIDEDEDKLAKISGTYDLMTYAGKPTSIKVQKDAGTAEADVFIAVTPDESRNMTCCMIASNLGCKKTIARIDNIEYMADRNREFFKGIGITSLVYPELLAAEEIRDMLKISWLTFYWKVSSSDLVLIGAKIRNNASIINTPLKQLGQTPYHVVAITRQNETIIPRGDDMILANDVVYFMVTEKKIPLIKEICGKTDVHDVKSALIVGGGKIAICVADLLPSSISVIMVEKDEKRCHQINEILCDKSNILVLNCDGSDPNLLEDENYKDVDVFISLTGNSEFNILACMNAKRMGIRKTIARVDTPVYAKMAESLDMGNTVNKLSIAATSIYQRLLKADVTNMKSLELAQADVAEFTIRDNAPVTRDKVMKLKFPHGVTIGGMVRNGESMLVKGNTQLQAGDHIVVFCASGMIKKIDRLF